jgi:hypothetical protein
MGGEIPRDDLRAEVTPGRNQAEELIEATLIAASDSFEETKLPLISHLLVAILFEPDLTHAQAHQLIATARSLTYRQLLLLAVFAARQPHAGDSLDYQGEGHEQEDPDEHELISVRVDMLDLYRRGLLRVSPRTASPNYDPWLGTSHDRQQLPWPVLPREMSPRDTWASNTGKRLARMMRLDHTSAEDRDELVMSHIGRGRPSPPQ